MKEREEEYIVVVNSSAPIYNLAAEKIANYHLANGDAVMKLDHFDLFALANARKVYFSAIFTRDLRHLVQEAALAHDRGVEVEIGGPAVTLLSDWVEERCGIKPHFGLDKRFEKIPGDYKWAFSSRGCPRDCPFCLVSKLEGKKVVWDDDFIPAPRLGDNNILMTSISHQKVVVEKLKRFPVCDINSGFDCRVFANDPEFYYSLYSRLNLLMWRFAFDTAEQEEPIRRVLEFLKGRGLDRHKVQTYALCNFPGVSPEEVEYRAEVIKGYGMMPYLMRYDPVDQVVDHYTAPG